MDRFLATDHLSVHFAGGRAPALDRITLEMPSGGSLAVLGPSGSGKTTLLLTLAGLMHAQEHARVDGTIVVDDLKSFGSKTWTAFPSVSMVPQDARHVFSGFVPTVREECQLTLRQAQVPSELWEEAVRTIAEALHIVPLLDRDPRTLSGGETQSVALAIMSVARPSLLLLDEPAASLDQDRLDALTRFLLRRPVGLAVIVADTCLHPAVLACNRVAILQSGRLAFHGTREEFWLRLPEFQDLVTLGPWLEVRRAHASPDAASFRRALEEAC